MANQDDMQQSQIGPADDLTTSDPAGDPDAGGIEYHQTHIAIIVNGKIVCKGTEKEPIIFTSSATNPHYTDWIGIFVNYGEFENTLVEWCLDGIYSTTGCERLTIDNCHVRHIWAAGIGFQPPAGETVVQHVKNSTIEDCGHEAIDTHAPLFVEFAYNLIKDSQVGFNLHDNINANIHHNIVLNTTFPVICSNTTDVFITQCTLQASVQDNIRWTYRGWTMPRFNDPAGIFVTNTGQSEVVVTNTILFDSPTGLRNESTEQSLINGYLNMDNVIAPYTGNTFPGAGCLIVNSGFVDKNAQNYRLTENSLLIGVGNPADGNPDIGAYGGKGASDIIGCNILF